MLNCLDAVMEEIVKRNTGGWLYLPEKSIGAASSPTSAPSELANDIKNAKLVLRVTIAMLKNSVNKDIYNSSEVCNLFSSPPPPPSLP